MPLPPAITSRTNARVKEMRAAFSGKAREPGEVIGVEGEHLISEATQAGVPVETLYVREGSERMLERPLLREVRWREVAVLAREVFDAAVDTHSPQGIAATLQIPEQRWRSDAPPRLCLLLEDLQDPGNLGTLVRSAKAFGAEAVWVSAASANVWNPKAVRASAGAIFGLPAGRVNLPEQIAWLRRVGCCVVAAVAQQAEGVTAAQSDLRWPCALMIGNEGAGLSEAARQAADERVWIPCVTESLNAAVAGSVLLYEALRQNHTGWASVAGAATGGATGGANGPGLPGGRG